MGTSLPSGAPALPRGVVSSPRFVGPRRRGEGRDVAAGGGAWRGRPGAVVLRGERGRRGGAGEGRPRAAGVSRWFARGAPPVPGLAGPKLVGRG